MNYQMPQFPLKERVIQTIVDRSLTRAEDGKVFTLASGKTSTYYLDLKKTLLSAWGAYFVAALMLDTIKERSPNVGALAGVALGGCPLVTAVSMRSAFVGFNPGVYNTLYVRKESKEHGTQSLIEGVHFPGMKVALLEDVVTSGVSSMKAVKTLIEAGLIVEHVYAVVDREDGGAELFASNNIPFTALLSIKDVL